MTLRPNYSLLILLALFSSCRLSQSQSTPANRTESELDAKELYIDHRIDLLKRDAGNVVTSGFLDSDGNMWFTSLTEGVHKYDGVTFINITTNDGPCSNNVNTVIEDTTGLLWFATSKGLCSYDGEVFGHFPLPQERVPIGSF